MADDKNNILNIVSVFSPLITTLIVVLGGTYLTQQYQTSQQVKDDQLKQINLLVQLMPYLSSKDSMQNSVSIYTLRCLGYDSLAGEIGTTINSVGTRSAIRDLSEDSTIPLAHRRIYMEKWSKLKKIPTRNIKPDSIQYEANDLKNHKATEEIRH